MMSRQRRKARQEEPENDATNYEQNQCLSPPPQRVAASPMAYSNDFYSVSDTDSQLSCVTEDDSHDGSPSKSRRDSVADADNYINAMAAGLGNRGCYESFTMESTPPSKTIPKDPSGKLYHRNITNHHTNGHTTHGYETNDYDDESPQHRLMRQRAFISPTHRHHAIQQLHDNPYHPRTFKSSFVSLAKRFRRTAMISRWTFGFAILMYVVILRQTISKSWGTSSELPYNIDLPNVPELWDCLSGSGYTRGKGCHRATMSWYSEQSKQTTDALWKNHKRRLQRKERTKIPTQSWFSTGTYDWHKVASLDERQQSETHGTDDTERLLQTVQEFATIDDLCGYTAKNSSKVSHESYPKRAALNQHSKVLITGILNPIGLSLALKLKQQCGVHDIYGVDAMYPNTVLNRLLAQERIQLLHSNTHGSASTRPVVLPYVGLDPKAKSSSKKSGKKPKKFSLQDEMKWMRDFRPTHVVHLASYSMDAYNDALADPEWKNTQSPYISTDHATTVENDEPFFYPLRSGMIGMEQLLSTIAGFPEGERPQFLYATNSVNSNDSPSPLFRAIKQLDELLVDTYHTRQEYQLSSIGLRLPNSIYGPWGQAGSIVHDIMEAAVEEYVGKTRNDTKVFEERKQELDLLYVDDAVDVIISSLQYRTEQPTILSVPAERTASVESVSSGIQLLLNGKNKNKQIVWSNNNAEVEPLREESLILPKTEPTTLKDGLVKSIAWYIDRLAPFGPAPRLAATANEDKPAGKPPTNNIPLKSGDNFLKRYGMKTCDHHDLACHKTMEYLPCNSECNVHEKCLPSVFDDSRELLYDVSEGCDVVMYTHMLGFNVEDAELHAEYMDDSNLDDDELLVCNFAIVPRESDLVSLVTGKVPTQQLSKFGIELNDFDQNTKKFRERKLDGLNGRLLYRGWILVWIKDGMRELSARDASLLKLSPSKFFHPSVTYCLFVERNFGVSPNLDDVLFLVNEMHRKKLGDRSLKKEEIIETPGGQITKKVKYRIPNEPARRAAILFAPLRYPNIDDPIVDEYRAGHRSLTIHHASEFMGYEVGHQQGENGSPSLRRQREFYERIPTYINKQYELRSKFEPLYQYSMRHWVRSRWVLHDLTLEESRLLRCDWYQEHVQWKNDLDQFSFAKIMAVRELKRHIAHDEPDDRVKSFIEMHPELHDLTDSYEWHSLETDVNKLYRDPTNWNPKQLPSATNKIPVDASGQLEEDSEEETPIYVRIMSERVMAVSRKIWSKMRKKVARTRKLEQQKAANEKAANE